MKRFREITLENDATNVPSSSKVFLVERNTEPNGVALVNSKRVATKSFEEMMDLEEDRILVDKVLKSTLNNKLDVIGRQAKNLHDLMVDVISEAKLSKELNSVACNFVKIPGHIYHLYERPSGQKYLSMLSPEEWANPPHKFMGSYSFKADLSWQEANQEDNKYNGVNFLRMVMPQSLKEAFAKSAISNFQ